MRILVTGSAGHLGEALVRSLRDSSHEAVGIDILESPFTARVGSIIDRIYDNARARRDLGWMPRCDFASVLSRLQADEDPRSAMARALGCKPYHTQTFTDGPYPVD